MPETRPKTSSWLDTLRISDEQYDALLTDLSRMQAEPAHLELRDSCRITFNDRRGLLMQVKNPGGTVAHFRVKPRDLSAGGMSILHGGFIHSGAECAFPLPKLDGTVEAIQGHVVRCRHLRRNVHEVGIRFSRAINVADYLSDAEAAIAQEQTLCGTALCVDESVDQRELLKFDLCKLGLEAVTATSAAAALNLMAHQRFSVVVVSSDLGTHTLSEFLKDARQAGYDAPILAVLDEADDRLAQSTITAGADTILLRPYAGDALPQAVRRCLYGPRQAGISLAAGHGPISDKWADEAMRPVILKYLDRLTVQVAELRSQLGDAKPDDAWRKACLRVKASAGGYGFPAIQDAARKLLETLELGVPQQISNELSQLIELCHTAADTARELSAADAPDAAPPPAASTDAA